MIKIFEKALCCPTGVCGTSIDDDLLRISAVMEVLKKSNVDIERHNLRHSPQAFVTHENVAALLKDKGMDVLPITVHDGEIVITGRYPTNQELSQMSGVNLSFVPLKRLN